MRCIQVTRRRRKSRRRDGWVLTTLMCGDGSAARKETPEPFLVRFHRHFLGFGGRRGPRWWGMGSCANSGQGCEPGSGPEPGGLRVRVRRPLPNPPPAPASAETPARARPGALRRRALFLSSLPMATPPRVLVSEPSGRWPWVRPRPSWPSLWGLDEITATCDKVKRTDPPLRAWRLNCLPRPFRVHMSV